MKNHDMDIEKTHYKVKTRQKYLGDNENRIVNITFFF